MVFRTRLFTESLHENNFENVSKSVFSQVFAFWEAPFASLENVSFLTWRGANLGCSCFVCLYPTNKPVLLRIF